jgi:hypothetical protein
LQAVTLLSQWQLEATVSHPKRLLAQRFFGAPLRVLRCNIHLLYRRSNVSQVFKE